ncbi:hypothetical protein BV22DRAFT_1032611 [Leucogyrophana mollusca]|uniref:Uncharacterized protein n=1 Tax=Leucogyrophana mollusca TaxID=85980 RepID=A0ACB8BME1_9AGAM|nr:hypothetical protein BV22DRAFT_1032611 [Leucogyrophana mollusca]
MLLDLPSAVVGLLTTATLAAASPKYLSGTHTEWAVSIYSGTKVGQGARHDFSDVLTGECNKCQNFPKALQRHLHALTLDISSGNPVQLALYKELDCHPHSYIWQYDMNHARSVAENIAPPGSTAMSLQVCGRTEV